MVIRVLISVRNYFRRCASEASRWIRGGTTLWRWLALSISILGVVYLIPGHLTDRVRWAGTVFEFIGVCAVVISINRARISFGKPSVLRGALIWIGEVRYIFFRRPPVFLSARSTMMGMGNAAAVSMVKGKSPQSLEQRLEEVENQVKELKKSVQITDQKVEQQKRELLDELRKEAAERQAGDQGVGKKLEESMIGDSALELAGIFYVCLGILMSHLSEEVAWLLGWLGAT